MDRMSSTFSIVSLQANQQQPVCTAAVVALPPR